MAKKLTQEEFIQRAKAKHGDKYDYSNTIYVNRRTKVEIRCRKHGLFYQNAGDHMEGHGCPSCKCETLKQLVCGIGVNDIYGAQNTIAWRRWESMLLRCYGKDYKNHRPTYIGCSVCKEWHKFSNFKRWFDNNYIEGYHLDKDILVRDNKVYSPETCCFIPHDINTLLLNRGRDRGLYPIGVSKQGNKYQAKLNIYGSNKYIGLFDTIDEAFDAYKREKENHIKEKATDYYNRGLIDKRVKDALFKYKVKITD